MLFFIHVEIVEWRVKLRNFDNCSAAISTLKKFNL